MQSRNTISAHAEGVAPTYAYTAIAARLAELLYTVLGPSRGV